MNKFPRILCFIAATCFCNAATGRQLSPLLSSRSDKASYLASISTCRALVWEKSEETNDKNLLNGLSELAVVVQRKHPLIPKVDFERIKVAIEAKCQASGVKIVNAQNPKTPLMIVTLDPISTGPGSGEPRENQVAWVASLDLVETSVLSSDMKTRNLSRLYSCQRLKCIGDLHATQSEIETDLLKLVDTFVNSWKMANDR